MKISQFLFKNLVIVKKTQNQDIKSCHLRAHFFRFLYYGLILTYAT